MESTEVVEKPMESTGVVEKTMESTEEIEKPMESTEVAEKPMESTEIEKPMESTEVAEKPIVSTEVVEQPMESTEVVENPLKSTEFVAKPMDSTEVRKVQESRKEIKPHELTELEKPQVFTDVASESRNSVENCDQNNGDKMDKIPMDISGSPIIPQRSYDLDIDFKDSSFNPFTTKSQVNNTPTKTYRS